MLQSARSSDSKSFLRELEDALVLIDNEKDKNYFLKQMQEVFRKRKDSFTTLTGEKALKSELLSYLKEKGYVQTANVWARSVPMDRNKLDELLALLQTRLRENHIEGILEFHLQDREINSPHFQFVGLNCKFAESIIAHTLVEFAYETSIESALSKKDFMPYYKENPKARVQDLNTALEYYERKKKGIITPYEDTLLDALEEASEELKRMFESFQNKRIKLTQNMQNLQTKLNDYKAHLRSKNQHYKRLRRKKRRR
ncbi:hypothetical protein CUPS4066_07100 [Campylobacter upsaliensis]|uniref:hypothetical protein n=1 Tax=Campylobacter upsaliensis TaxID=28080 RepID=UPI00214A62D0|nr:hypothetical protein [Campylobacter upsaliensis]MCR2108468.1 hypothetical protein [Campylobacter upsaliensis]